MSDQPPAMPNVARTPTGRSMHIPVMRERVVQLLSPALQDPHALLVDGTLGLAGHASAVLAANPSARLIGLDRDPQALTEAAKVLTPFADRYELVQANFDELANVLAQRHIRQVQAVLLDLGLSSLQIDRPDRGFSYAVDAPLDMRMDPGGGLTAADVVNGYSLDELVRVLRLYGEEPQAARIARRIVRARERGPLTGSRQLVEVIEAAVPPASRRRGHVAKRTFQALRIEVNGELDALQRVLPQALGALAVGGRMVVLAYHSLEDRLVKQAFAAACASTAPLGLPVVPPEYEPRMVSLTRGAERPDADEIAANPRASSARLRAVQRIRPEEVAR